MHLHFTNNHYFRISTLAVLILIITTILPVNVLAKQFPDLGDDARSALSINDEKFIGDIWMQQLRASNAICEDIVINSYLNNLGHQLLIHSDIKHFNFVFFGIEDYAINAFAFFGGHIGIHKGLILATQNENELAAAMAHEIAHISQEHLLRHIIKNKQFFPITIAGALASAILGVPDLIIPILATHEQRIINFTREHEQEADNIGMQLLAHAGFDPQSMPTLFKRMSQQAQYSANIPEYLLTHPIFETRISEAQNRARHFNYRQRSSSFNYHLIKARIESKASANQQEIISRFKEQLANKRYENKAATLYGYALALAANHEYQPADKILHELANQYPNNLIIQLGLCDMEIANQQPKQATKQMEQLLLLFPEEPALILKYSEHLLAIKEAAKAKQLLLQLINIKVFEPITYQLLAQAENSMGNKVGMYTATAEWHLLYGELDSAVVQLDMALSLVQGDAILKANILKRKKAIAEIISKKKQL